MKNARLLVVDDVALSVSVLCDLLEDLGFQADAAGTRDAAVTMVRGNTYHLILINATMSGMAGAAIANAILNLPGCTDIPVIGMIPDDNGDRTSLLSAGVRDFIFQPVRADTLLVARATIDTDGVRIDLRTDGLTTLVADLRPTQTQENRP